MYTLFCTAPLAKTNHQHTFADPDSSSVAPKERLASRSSCDLWPKSSPLILEALQNLRLAIRFDLGQPGLRYIPGGALHSPLVVDFISAPGPRPNVDVVSVNKANNTLDMLTAVPTPRGSLF